MTVVELQDLVDKERLLEIAEGDKRVVGRILKRAGEFNRPRHSALSPEEVTNLALSGLYGEVIRTRGIVKGLGEKSIHAMSNYLMENDIIDVDYRFGHLPVIARHPEANRLGHPPFERAEVTFKESGPRRVVHIASPVYTAGIFIDRQEKPKMPLLVFGNQLYESATSEKGRIDPESLLWRPVEDISGYQPLIPQNPRFAI